MRLIIGTDEAGYGPNLGPLVVAATAWRCADHITPPDLFDALTKVLTNAPRSGDSRLHVADSKAVYQSGDGLESLEVPVLAFLGLLNLPGQSISELGTAIAGNRFTNGYLAEPWNALPGLKLPVDSSVDHISEWIHELRIALPAAEIELLGICCRVIFPAEFNRLVAAADSKGVVLSTATLELVRQLRDAFPEYPAMVVCDKHGGRNRYDELIAAHFDDQFVFRLEESRDRSLYRMGNMEFCFRTKAEALLPAALASMAAKYLREVLMRQFNEWWKTQIPGLRPTQGYPVDARRFLEDIQHQLTGLGVAADVLWRSR